MQYKAAIAGSTVIVADRWFASSRVCSACNAKNQTLTLTQRTWTCVSCGTFHDRDLNAARNLARYPESSPRVSLWSRRRWRRGSSRRETGGVEAGTMEYAIVAYEIENGHRSF
jgi:transposase